MQKITSFQVNHDTLEPGIYISRIDGDITTYDIRMKKPNNGDYLANDALHTIEHLLATYVRNSQLKDSIIYAGPMGCRTGFYLLVRNADHDRVISLLKEAFLFIKDYEGSVPGCKKIECGNYLDHNLPKAKKEAAKYYEVIKNYNNSQIYYRSI